MAHRAEFEFLNVVAGKLGGYFAGQRVLEIGSLDINGSIRNMFGGGAYVGVDVAPGSGVDVVCEGQNYDAPDGSFDVTICCEVMEHNPHWAATFRNMIRLCRPGGLVVMTCATTGRPEHGTARTDPDSSPLTVDLGWNYYRNLTEKDMRRAIDFAPAFAAHRFWVNWNHYDLLFAGIRAGNGANGSGLPTAWAPFERAVDDWLRHESGTRVHRYRATMASVLGDRWFVGMNRVTQTLSWLHGLR